MAGSKRLTLVGVLLVAAVAVGWYRSEVFDKTEPVVVQRPKFVVLTGGSSPYWQLLGKGALAAGNEIGAEIELLEPERDEDVKTQTKMLSSILAERVDGVALSPLDAEQQTRFINELALDTLVVTVDSDAPLSNRLCYVGASNYAAGQLCGDLVTEAASKGGKLIVILANLTKDNIIERKLGLEEKLMPETPPPVAEGEEAPPTYEIAALLQDEGDLAKVERQLAKALEEHPDTACIVVLNSYQSGTVLKTLEQLDLLGKMKVVSFDTMDETLDGVEKGHIFATVAQDPYQYGVEAVQRLLYSSKRTLSQLPLVGAKSTVTISVKALRAKDIEEFRKLFTDRMASAEAAENAS